MYVCVNKQNNVYIYVFIHFFFSLFIVLFWIIMALNGGNTMHSILKYHRIQKNHTTSSTSWECSGARICLMNQTKPTLVLIKPA